MFQILPEELTLNHRHEDGSWGRLEPRPTHHDPADHDPERDWSKGQLYVCATCDEEVMVQSGDIQDQPPS